MKVITITTEQFIEQFGFEKGFIEKYNEGWEDIVIEMYLKKGIQFKFVEEVE